MIYNGLSKEIKDPRYTPVGGDVAVKAQFTVYDLNAPVQHINPLFILRENQYATYLEDTIAAMGVEARFSNLIVRSKDSASVELMVRQTDPMDDFIVLKALVFPYINVLWIGIVIMVLGFFISLGDLVSRQIKFADNL